MNKINKKIYYKIEFELASPLMIGNGENQFTDKDIAKNSKGQPYVPGSALAGINRALIKDDALVNQYFGYINNNDLASSKFLFYDANLVSDTAYVTRRDSVALNENKTVDEDAKFDMEVVETGAKFVTFIEQNVIYGDNENFADQLLQAWLNEDIYIGAKTMRGYGAIKNVHVVKKAFCFDGTDSNDVSAWLDFDMYADQSWVDSVKIEKKECTPVYQLCLELKQAGGISIRRYTTEVAPKDSEKAMPDQEQLTLKNGKPIIPGTSWAGAFRHRIKYFAKQSGVCEDVIKECFGIVETVKQDNQKVQIKKRAKVRFSETELEGTIEKVLSRNSIDRFTGGTVDGALFTDKTFYDGTTTLTITFEENPSDEIKRLFAAAIADLNAGYLAVGGLTAIGRGLFQVKKVNGQENKNNHNLYNNVYEVMKHWGV